ncbi:MAG: ABC transporter permease [Chloroflexota bacterium]
MHLFITAKTELLELWHYRHLLWMLIVRDLKSRYQNSALGIFWSFIQPLAMTGVMTFAFTRVAPSGTQTPRAYILIMAGLLAWNYFSAAIVNGAGSVIANGALVKKVYFPRALLPIASVLANGVNYLLAVPLFLLIAVISGHPLHWTLIFVPFIFILQTIFTIGLAFFLSTLNIFYRDTQFILDLGMLILFFLTPIWYDINVVNSIPIMVFGVEVNPSYWLPRINLLASFINLYQAAMYKGQVTVIEYWLRTSITAIVVFILGFLFFRKFSPRFGEEI